jgi:hypothetical protein
MRTGAEVRTGQPVPNPRMRLEGVSVAIVLGGRESRPHGEGPHRERWVRSNPAECEGLGILADVSRALRAVNPLMGSPYAVKAARPGCAVRRFVVSPTQWGGTWRNVLGSTG